MKILSRLIVLVAIVVAFAAIIVAISADAQYEASSCNDGNDDESCNAAEENPDVPPPPIEQVTKTHNNNAPISAIFRNNSPYRADVHFDDGRFGNVTAAPSPTKCKDRYPVCVDEAKRGECARNPGWMIVNCCKSCDDAEGFGHLIDSEVRCDPKRLNSTIPAWKSGSLDELFTKWATNDGYKQYEPHVVSSPGKVHGAEYDGPWVITFDAFIDDLEIRELLKGAEFHGFQRSTDQGKIIGGSGEMAKVTSTKRTSSNAWCRDKCEGLPGVQRVTKRIEDVTGVPQKNYESFQILQYHEGQFYKHHHDSSQTNNAKSAGHRILTFFLYLNDVEEGGETRFTNLDISIKPKKGRALVWPSVLNEDPNSSDMRMYHEAKEVIKGTKYAANHWTQFINMTSKVQIYGDAMAVSIERYFLVHIWELELQKKYTF
ncbi:hypothetical protein ACHAXR_004565 [Thalassiosira sp. AJA248-18]